MKAVRIHTCKTFSLSVNDVVRQYGEAARYGAASNSRVSAANARQLGWSPTAPSLRETLEEHRFTDRNPQAVKPFSRKEQICSTRP
jgi:hypothetical protein